MPRRARLVRFGGRLWLQVLVRLSAPEWEFESAPLWESVRGADELWLWAGGPLHGYVA